MRADEAKRMTRDGYEPILKHSRWPLLKKPENLTEHQSEKLTDLLQYNLKTILTFRRAYGFKYFKTTEIALYHSLGKLPEPHNHPQILRTRHLF